MQDYGLTDTIKSCMYSVFRILVLLELKNGILVHMCEVRVN